VSRRRIKGSVHNNACCPRPWHDMVFRSSPCCLPREPRYGLSGSSSTSDTSQHMCRVPGSGKPESRSRLGSTVHEAGRGKHDEQTQGTSQRHRSRVSANTNITIAFTKPQTTTFTLSTLLHSPCSAYQPTSSRQPTSRSSFLHHPARCQPRTPS